MYGDPEGIASNPVTLSREAWTDSYNSALNKTLSHDRIDLVPKLRRQVVFPNAALLALLIILRVVWYFVGKPVITLIRFVRPFTCPTAAPLHFDCMPACAPSHGLCVLCLLVF